MCVSKISIVDAIFYPEMIPYLPENNLKTRGRLFEILFALPEENRIVLENRYGIDTDKKSFKQIAEIIGKSESRARQIEGKSLGMIHRKLQIGW